MDTEIKVLDQKSNNLLFNCTNDSQLSILYDKKCNNNSEGNMKTTALNETKSRLSKISQTSSNNNLISNSKNNKLPVTIIIGTIQLVLSIILVTLGCLIFARETTFSNALCGIWSGGFAAIPGVLGIINIKKVRTGFLAMSLVCVATSTLAIAITGIAVARDTNSSQTNQDEVNYRNVYI